MTATSGISYRLILQHETEEKKPVRTECLAFQVYAHRSVVDPSLLTDDDPQRSSRTIGRISGTGIVLDSKSVEISKSDPFN